MVNLKHGRYKPFLIVMVLLAVALSLRLANINREFSGDETLVAGFCSQSFDKMFGLLLSEDVYPPITYLAVHYMMKISQAEAFIRLYFVFFGLGGCLIVYFLAKEYAGIKTARIALALSAFSPLLVFASQYVRSYMDSAFWMLLSCLCLLKILKGAKTGIYWAGYILSVALSLYTSYYSTLLIATQALFIALYVRDKKTLFRWAAAYLAIGLLFLPWVPQLLHQYQNVTVSNYDWSSKGFNFGPLRVGMYARNVLALIGFDPFFMVYQGGMKANFPKIFLIMGTFSVGLVFTFFLYQYIGFSKNGYRRNAGMAWFLPLLALGPVVISSAAVSILKILPVAKYLVAFHAIFLILIAIVITHLHEKRRLLGGVILALALVLFSLRLPYATASEFDTKNAVLHLKRHMGPGEPLVCINSCPDTKDLNIIMLGDHFTMNPDRSKYMISPPGFLEEAGHKISNFKKVWFYRVYGTCEIFGGNSMVEAWLSDKGFRRASINRFKNINIEEYEKNP